MKPYVLYAFASVACFAIAGCLSRKHPPMIHPVMTILATGLMMTGMAVILLVIFRWKGVAGILAFPQSRNEWTRVIDYAGMVALGDVLLIFAYMKGGDPRTIQGIVACLPVITFSLLFIFWRDAPPSRQHLVAMMVIVLGVLMFLNAEANSSPTEPSPPDLRIGRADAQETIPPPHTGRPF